MLGYGLRSRNLFDGIQDELEAMRRMLEDVAVGNVGPWRRCGLNRFWIIGHRTCSAQVARIIVIADDWIHFRVIDCGECRINHQAGREQLHKDAARWSETERERDGEKVQLNFCSENFFRCRHHHRRPARCVCVKLMSRTKRIWNLDLGENVRCAGG